MKPKVTLFSDGSCPVPHKGGGWGYILRLENGLEKIGSGGESHTTNNRMELSGVINGLKVLPISCDVEIISDSRYVVDGIDKWYLKWKKKGWKKKNWDTGVLEDVANKDLWIELDLLLQKHVVKTTWVRGHAGHPENEKCDVLCSEAMKIMRKNAEKGT